MREFAQELVDLVIDSLAAAGNTRDIGACGRVCWGWLPRSRMHLFSCLTIWNALPRDSRRKASLPTTPATTESFLNLADSSLIPILPLVHRLDLNIVLHEPWPSEQDMARFQSSCGIRDLRIHGMEPLAQSQELQFVHGIHTHVPRFGASLTQFELGLPTPLPLHVLADLLSRLPCLEGLRICSETFGAGINDSQNAPPADKFPALLHKLDVALYRGTSLLFRWLLSAREPPIFTTLVLGGRSAGEPMGPIHAYLRRFGSQIKSLSLGYWVDELIGETVTSFVHPSFWCLVLAFFEVNLLLVHVTHHEHVELNLFHFGHRSLGTLN
ncbi:hypothetical protein K438DRAFT_1789922 [Mycena galopus ATCC 62051]|nr:hypothetical protein K438DRAFT_1789922 [Mycena galopus ATCC 62051]